MLELDDVMLVELHEAVGGHVGRGQRIVEPMDPEILAQQQRHHLHVEPHQPLGHALAPGLGQRLDPFAHPIEVGTVAGPAIEVEQSLDLFGHREAEQVARVSRADFLDRVEERLGRERLHQPLGFGCRQDEVALLARGQPVEKLELGLERKAEKLLLSCRGHYKNARCAPRLGCIALIQYHAHRVGASNPRAARDYLVIAPA